MEIPAGAKVTTQILLWGALIFALLDAAWVPLLAWKIKTLEFRQLKWPLVITTGLFWCGMWAWVLTVFWEPVYHYVFPDNLRWFIPPLYGLLFAAVARLFWGLALRLPENAVFTYVLLSGSLGLLTHVWAIYRGILEKPPLLQGAAPAAALVIAAFEFIFYGCSILSVAWLAKRVGQRLARQQVS